jgi:uncharacterized membrane protein YbaN (DUF454 family)
MNSIKKIIFLILGFISLGFAYIGLITPGIPYSPFIVASAYFFAKSSKRMHNWIYNHRIFGPFLINWETKKIFPKKMKYFMLIMMSTSLTIIFFTVPNILVFIYTALIMLIVAIWAWRFPGSLEEYEHMKEKGIKIKWYGF